MTLQRRKVAKAGALVLAGGVGVAALLWSKLRLLTDVPRTTYAEPEQARDADEAPAAGRSESGDEDRRDEDLSVRRPARPGR